MRTRQDKRTKYFEYISFSDELVFQAIFYFATFFIVL